MYMVEISEDKVCGLAENVEKSLKYMGKVMQCIDELKSESSERKGNRDYDEDEEDYEEREERYGERYGERGGSRRGMRGRGRYSRY